jgi:hypothetical protein
MPICRLCGSNTKLMGAHIVPHGSFRRARAGGPPLEFIRDDGHQGAKSRGFIDPDILCSACDGSFSPAEQYLMLYLEQHHETPNTHSDLFVDTAIDYDKLKLAILFTIWKMAISSRPEFKAISLTPAAETKLKALMQARSPGNADEFPISLRRLRWPDHNAESRQVILSPKQDGTDITFLVQGWEIIACVADDCSKWRLLPAALAPGKLTAAECDLPSSPYWNELMALVQAAKEPPRTP